MDPALKQRIRPILNSRRKRINDDLDVLQRLLEALAMEIYAWDFDHLDAMAKGETGPSEAVATLIEVFDFRDALEEAESAVEGLMGDLKKGPDKAIRAWSRRMQESQDPAVLVRKVRNVLGSCEKTRERRRAAGEDLPPLRHRMTIACVVRDGAEPAIHDLAVAALSDAEGGQS